MSDSENLSPANKRICPKCEALNEESRLHRAGYRCVECSFEMAYTDHSPNGSIRGIYGYLKSAGDVVNDRYRVRQVLGKGGFGATYLVQDLRLQGKRRALKEIPQRLFDEQEVKLLSQLNHPSIPDITDRFILDGFSYLVLEFGGTRTLGSECHAQGRIPLGILLSWMRQLCEALIYLHSQHPPVIHRDLKPENVLLDDNDRIMLIDFGIAKESSHDGATRLLARAGSHGYSPPEQMFGTGTDERSDIYSLGATFYRLLTGQTPPPAHERVAGKELTNPSAFVPGLPPDLDDLLVSMMSLNLNHRPASVDQVSNAIASLDGGAPGLIQDFSKTTMIPQALSTSRDRRPKTSSQGFRIPTGPPQPIAVPESPPQRLHPAWLFSAAAIFLAALLGAVILLSRKAPESSSVTMQTNAQQPGPVTQSPPLTAIQGERAPTTPSTEIQTAEPTGPQPQPQRKLASPLDGRPTKTPAPVSLSTLEPNLPAAKTDPSGSTATQPVTQNSAPAMQPAISTPPPTAIGPKAATGPEAESGATPKASSTSSAPVLSSSNPPATTSSGLGQQPASPAVSNAPTALESFERTREKQTQTEQPKQSQASQAESLIKKQPAPRPRSAPAKSNDSGWTIRYIQ